MQDFIFWICYNMEFNYENRKKKQSKSEVYSEIKRLFSLSPESNLFVQIFNDDFQEWCDVDCMVDLPAKAKLLLSCKGDDY